jgi:AcrR family transcriptional regulator
MLAAAHGLFVEHGYAGTRMTDVADAAGVAVQTVYFTFHTKAELLQACFDRAVLGEDDPRPPPQQPWYAEMLAAPTGAEALRHFAGGNGSIAARVARLAGVVASAKHEPEAVAVHERSETLRRDGYQDVVEQLAARFGLRAGVDVDAATDILLTLGGHAVYASLVVDYGWSQEAYVDWLSEVLAGTLLG